MMDRICGFFIFFLGIAILWQGRHLEMGSLRGPGPGFFPNLVAILMMVLSLLLMIPRRKGNGESVSAKSSSQIFIVFITLLAYSFTLEYLGFVFSSFLLMAYLFKAFGGSKRWGVAVLLASVSVGFAYLLFDVLLKGNLPKGIFGI
jgi:hypothetical protein